MDEPLHIIRKEHRDRINDLIRNQGFAPNDFLTESNRNVFTYKLKKEPRLYFILDQHSNDLDRFSTAYTCFTPNFKLVDLRTSAFNRVKIVDVLTRFNKWLSEELVPYAKEANILDEKKITEISDVSFASIRAFKFDDVPTEALDEEIVHRNDEGKPLTLKQLIEDFDRLERTNRSTGEVLTDTSHFFEQSKARVSELNGKLIQAENEKAKLHQEIQLLNQKSTNDKSELAKHQASAKQFENEKQAELGVQKQKLRDDVQRLQSTIDTLKNEKEILQVKLQASKKDLEQEQNKPSVVASKLSATLENTTVHTPVERDFYKLFLTSTYVLVSYVWLSSSTKIIGFEVKDNFKYGVAIAVLILYGVLFFSNREKIKDNIVQFIIGIGAVVLGAFFFYR
jgi:hypothetical protein